MIVVVDTNILVSALLSANGPAAKILELALIGELQIAFDDRIWAEYREVLARPRFGFPPDEVGAVLDMLHSSGVAIRATALGRHLPDPTDQAFLEVAAQVDAPLITGNQRHFPPDVCAPVFVYSPPNSGSIGSDARHKTTARASFARAVYILRRGTCNPRCAVCLVA